MKQTLTIVLLFALQLVYGQTDKKHPIDIALENCLNKEENYTTRGMSGCVLQAHKQWDAQLNTNYQELRSLLTAQQQQELKTAQVAWLQFRDKEFSFANPLYTDMKGSIFTIVAAQTKLEVTKQRALALRMYINSIEPAGY